jgi:hypothetical protein
MDAATGIRVAISVAALALIAARLIWPDLKIDAITTALAVIAIVPWLSSVIERAVFPGGWEVTFRKVQEQEDRLNAQGRIIAEQQKIINDLVIFSMAWYLFDLLKGIYYAQKTGAQYLFRKNDQFMNNLRYLRDNGYIGIEGIRTLQDGQNLAHLVRLTPIGSYYVELREKSEEEAQKSASEQKAT